MADNSISANGDTPTDQDTTDSEYVDANEDDDSETDGRDSVLDRAYNLGGDIDHFDDDERLNFGPEVEIEVEEEEEEEEAANEEATDSDPERTLRQRRYLLQLLQHSNLRDVLHHFTATGTLELVNDDDDEDGNPRWMRARRRRRPDPNRFPKVPSDRGRELMNSGTFGSNDTETARARNNHIDKKKRLAKRILDRELARESYTRQKENQRLMAQGMIPSSSSDMIIHFDEPVYSGQFSDDGNFFFSANKDYKVRMYDTSNPYKWRHYKTVEYPFGQWTLTDASLSPDNKYLAYTSIRSQVCLAPTDPNDMGDPYVLELASVGRNRVNHHSPSQVRYGGGNFGIWSIRFSGDGRQLIAGATGGSIVVFDIESRQSLHRIYGHDQDVNAVCFGDKSSPHILYSGSDDTTLKVWDTRSMGDSRAAGGFFGHIEGLTYIDSKGDGRYILSNGKDQSMKLWDLRMVMAPGEFEAIKPTRRATNEQRFDYRWGAYDEDDWYQDPHDNSLVTFRGHKVLRTLIRCHFSPPGSTNSRYVYSGSEDGKVYVYNMDATLAGKIDVYAATKNTRPYEGYHGMDWNDDGGARWRTCVRDAAWHPSAPIIVSSAFNGYGSSTGTCTIHSWNDGAEDDEAEPRMGLRVGPECERDEQFYQPEEPSWPTARAARIRVLRARRMLDEDD